MMEQYKKQVGEKPKTETSIQNIRMDNSDYGPVTTGRKRLFHPSDNLSQRGDEEKLSRPQMQQQFAFSTNQTHRQMQSPQVHKESQWQVKSPLPRQDNSNKSNNSNLFG